MSFDVDPAPFLVDPFAWPACVTLTNDAADQESDREKWAHSQAALSRVPHADTASDGWL